MCQRSITYCTVPLQEAWFAASDKFIATYPTAPTPILTCTYRSNEEQNALYNQPWDGKDNDGDGKIDEPDEKVTKAKAGQSYHNFYPSRAFDVAFRKGKTLDWTVENFQKFYDIIHVINPNIVWGGNWKFKDYPHFQL